MVTPDQASAPNRLRPQAATRGRSNNTRTGIHCMRRFTYEYPFPGALRLPNKYGTITLLSDGLGLRNRVIPFPTRGVASTQPTSRQQRTLEQTVAVDRFIRIVGTGRIVAAPASQYRGKQSLVPSDQHQTQSFHRNRPLPRNDLRSHLGPL